VIEVERRRPDNRRRLQPTGYAANLLHRVAHFLRLLTPKPYLSARLAFLPWQFQTDLIDNLSVTAEIIRQGA
jgi:hypothetical protein